MLPTKFRFIWTSGFRGGDFLKSVNHFLADWIKFDTFYFKIQTNLSYVTLQGDSEIGSHKTGGHLIQV